MPTQSPEFFPIAVISDYLHHKEQINWTGQLNTRTAYQRRQGLNWSSYTEALGHQNCGLVIFHNIYINAFPREKSRKIKECGHRVSSHLGVHITACLFVPYLYGPWGKRRELCATLMQLCSKRDCSELRASGLLHTQLAHGVRSAFTIGIELLLSVLFCYCSTAWTLGTSPSRRKRTAEGKTKYGGTEKYLQNPGDPSGNSPNTGIERSFQAETNYSEGFHTPA